MQERNLCSQDIAIRVMHVEYKNKRRLALEHRLEPVANQSLGAFERLLRQRERQ